MDVRCSIAFNCDTAFPRDALTITPHYTGSENPQGLADQIKTKLQAIPKIGSTAPFTIKVYDAAKTKPSYPLATASQIGSPLISSAPREVALCLSYYAGRNIPRQRGRLYIPLSLLTGACGKIPTTTQMDEVLITWGNALVKQITAAAFCVWSRVELKAHLVDNLWVDDEWDTVRSRGMKPQNRRIATVP